jgi:RNA polymerase sigma-70 factor (ECF subfamily)
VIPGDAENSEGQRTPPRVLAASSASVVPESPARSAVGQLARAHAALLARFFRYLGVPPRDVEDALQDVFLVAHRRLHETPELAERPDAWLRGIAVNVARNRRRREARSLVRFVEDAPEVPDARTPEADVAAEHDRRRLLELLAALPADHRAALVLFEIEGRPMREVALALGCALPTAYKYVSLAQARLKQAFLEHGEVPR